MNPRVDRYLTEKAMDHIDHALGRHVDPIGETSRNYFAIDGALADEMAASPYWKEFRRYGDMRFFSVTRAGREALAAHLKSIADPHRTFVLSFKGCFDGEQGFIAAPSAAKARYAYWLKVSDCWSELTFGEFCRMTRVRRAA